LWSDGAEKSRWIYLPPGTVIDNADPNEWIFPVGTKLWKEFQRDGRRVETRLWQKVSATYWANATYAWSEDETKAVRSAGGDIPWKGGTYHIPTNDECQKCHRGRNERILGFEQVLLGLPDATGLTLERLIAAQRLTVPPASPVTTIGDDGTGQAAPALAWLHVNCGTTCHNRNSSSSAWASKLFMRLEPTQLDGRSSAGFDTVTSTVGVTAVTPAWSGQTRVVAGHPEQSLLFQLISHRGTGVQMPPIATSVVDAADVARVESWISAMAPAAADGGASDGGVIEAGADLPDAKDAQVQAVDAAIDASSADQTPPGAGGEGGAGGMAGASGSDAAGGANAGAGGNVGVGGGGVNGAQDAGPGPGGEGGTGEAGSAGGGGVSANDDDATDSTSAM